MSESGSFIENLIAELERCVKKYADDNGALFFESKTVFKGQPETFDNVYIHNIDVYFNSYIIRFSYIPHVPFTTSHSALTCAVSLEKAETQRLFYPLAQVFGYLGVCPENALTIPLIFSADSMTESFNSIAADLKTITSEIRDLSYDTERKEALFNAEAEAAGLMFKKEYPTPEELQKQFVEAKREWYPLWKAQISAEDGAEMQGNFDALMSSYMHQVQSMMYEDKRGLLEYYYNFITARAINTALEAYMTGNYALALKKLKKQKYISSYENILTRYMESAQAPRVHVPESIYENFTKLYTYGIPKNSFKEALAIMPAMLLFGLMWLPLFLAVYFLFYFFENKGAVYLLGPLENAPSVMFPALLCSIPMIYFNYKLFCKIFFRKNYQRLMELDNATRTYSTHKFMKGLTAVLILCSIIFLALTVHQNIKLTETGLYDNTRFWSIRGDYYSYDEIDKVYYRDKTPDGYGDMMDISSYVILLKSGEEIDPYNFNTCDDKFLKVLRERGVFVESP